MRVAVIGTGYVGLVSGAGLSSFGNDVICVDVDADRIARLEAGEIPIHEPGLEELVTRSAAAGRLRFSTDTAASVAGVDVVIVAVGTPTSQNSGAPDLRYLESAARDIGRGLTGYAVIANKSTVPVGTADRVRELVAEHTDVEFSVASNPEFLKEGDAVNDFMKPSRIVLGTGDDRATEVLRNLYEPFVRTNDRIQVMDVRSAELTKYAANAMLATRISFMNELALLAEKVGADIERVRRGIGSDPRIGAKFLFPGVGFGGSCFPKDLRALIHTGRQFGVEVGVIEAVARANERQKLVLGAKIRAHFADRGDTLSGKRIAIWGLSFKPETDDIREAPSLVLIDELLAGGAQIVAADPQAGDNARERLGEAVEIAEMYAAAEGADALALVTEWHQFRRPDFRRLKEIMREPALFDGRNIWPAERVRELGFSYQSIGRP